MNAVQLASTSVMCGELARGQVWFERASELNSETNSVPWPTMHMNFLSALADKGELVAGMPHVEWLKRMYEAMRTTDDHFVFMRGMPFLGVFLEKSLPFLRASKSEPEVLACYYSMREHLDPEGQAKLDEWTSSLPSA